MSQINATITAIEAQDILHIVSFDAAGKQLKMMSLDLDSRLAVGTAVVLSVKATAVALAKALQGSLSYSNQILVQIEEIQSGKLLTTLSLKSDTLSLESIITTASATRMALAAGEQVTALIKSSDLSIIEIC